MQIYHGMPKSVWRASSRPCLQLMTQVETESLHNSLQNEIPIFLPANFVFLACKCIFLDALASLKTMLVIKRLSYWCFQDNKISRVLHINKVLQSITEYYRVLQSIAEFCRVLQSITEYCRVLQGIAEYCRVLQSTTEYYRPLQSLAGYCRVIQSIREYCRVL